MKLFAQGNIRILKCEFDLKLRKSTADCFACNFQLRNFTFWAIIDVIVCFLHNSNIFLNI